MSARCFFALALLAGSLLAGQAEKTGSQPTAEQQNAMLAAMARFAEQYVSNLPNFLCLQTTEQYEGNKKAEHWKKGDTLSMRLAYSNGKEHRTLEQVNNKPVQTKGRGARRPFSTEGEFGPMLANVFADGSNAKFDWEKWDTFNGRRVAVFNYKIDREHSQMKMGTNYVTDITVGYHGAVYGDPATGEVFKMSSIASEIPSELPQREVTNIVAYDFVPIGTSKYLLPSHYTVFVKSDRNTVRNESQFRDYKKFEAESTLKFDTDDSSKTPPQK